MTEQIAWWEEREKESGCIVLKTFDDLHRVIENYEDEETLNESA